MVEVTPINKHYVEEEVTSEYHKFRFGLNAREFGLLALGLRLCFEMLAASSVVLAGRFQN